ncbi:hypothetical protein [Aestuariivirga sp.]|uniref:hypothetical protein n=1 Tax=Aestuariivirga sp. TaxID=2650926 RepID=UPI0039E50E45
MGRIAAFLGVLLLSVGPAYAGQAGANFNVGMRIVSGSAVAARAAAPKAVAPVKRYTWGAAGVSVRKAGFGILVPTERADALYWFTAERNGSRYRVAVEIATGRIVKVIPA